MVDDAADDPELDALELDAFDRVTFTDEELTEMALDAQPFDPFDPEVERFGGDRSAEFAAVPEWYMPAPGVPRTRGKSAMLFAFVIALVVGTVGGYCVTYGVPEFVWNW